ncbi:MAG: Serine/threonine-protein kinase PknD [Anaerolineales bacterium]|nr:Serine/threonine-protein kinase PknD [Anaerolineales bacterium]
MFPEKIGIYEIKSELGRGGMATVYRGYDSRFEREVAVKILPPELLHADPQFRARFQREAKIIAQLEHPSIVPVYDVGETEDTKLPYFVMKYMNGGSLSERIKKGIMSVAEAARILEQIAPGLDEAHSRGFIHRDLKPSNILFDSRGTPYISDFGIAKISQGTGTMTGSGIIGTPAYMAPEQATGDSVDGRADIYALGIILFEMLTGKQPYEADTPMAVAIKHVTDPVPRILTFNPNLPPDMDLIIQKAMAKDRNDRFNTAVEMVQTLKEIAGDFGPEKKTQTLTALRTAVKQKPTDGKKKLSPATIAFIALGILGVAAAGLFLSNRNSLPVASEATDTAAPVSTATVTAAPTIESTTTSAPATETPTLIPPTETLAPQIPLIGGADKVAFLRNNDIWIMNVDGSDLRSVTNDARAKSNVEWLPDGNTILYVTGKTVKTVNITDQREEILTSFASAEYFDAFRVSPDGQQVAVSVNRELHIVPFDIGAFTANTTKADLLAMNGCLFYNNIGVKNVWWSKDGEKLAIEFSAPSGANVADTIRILDIHLCKASEPIRQDEFPAARFQFPLEIITLNWDGNQLFALNSNIRNDGFGDLVFYNTFTHKAETVAPVDGKCCYRDAAFSPDGTYVIFAFQDINLGTESPIVFYYIPTGSLTTEGALEPVALPDGFFTRRNDAPLPVFRPYQP